MHTLQVNFKCQLIVYAGYIFGKKKIALSLEDIFLVEKAKISKRTSCLLISVQSACFA